MQLSFHPLPRKSNPEIIALSGLVRLSVGFEAAEDLIEDLAQG